MLYVPPGSCFPFPNEDCSPRVNKILFFFYFSPQVSSSIEAVYFLKSSLFIKIYTRLWFLKYQSIKSILIIMGLPWWFSAKGPTCQCRRYGFSPWWRRSPGEGNGNPLQHSCLGNPMDRGAWQATVHGVAKEPDMT